MARPAVAPDEKARRGTLQASRITKPDQRKVHPPDIETRPSGPPRPFLRLFGAYVDGVLDGSITASRWVRLACQRHRRDMARAARGDGVYGWDGDRVAHVCAFVETLPHTEGRWTTDLIRLEPWQIFVLGSLFGWRHRATPERRRFSTLYLEVARKSAKSTLMAAIALYHLLHEREIGATVICGATTGSQARIVFSIAARMVQRSPALRLAGLQAFANAIITADGSMRPVNARASTQDGLNPSCIVLDESHAQDFGLHDVLKSAQGSRLNPLLLCPTTAGYDLLSVGYALRVTVTKILQRVVEADHVWGAIYTLDDDDDWRDERVWIKANPMIGITPSLDWVRQYCTDAQQTPGLEGEFRVKVCSQWLQSASGWLSLQQWDACADPSLRLDDFAGQSCWIGGDLADKNDIAAIAALFRRGGDVVAFVRCYLPRDVVDDRARLTPEYAIWARDGHLVLTDGNYIDEDRIDADLRDWTKRFRVQALRFDQFGSGAMVSRFQGLKFDAGILHKNATNMTPPAIDFDARIKSRRFRHDGNPVLRWMAANVCIRRYVNGSMLPQKETEHSPNKIDAIDAMLCALSPMLVEPVKPRSPQIFIFGR